MLTAGVEGHADSKWWGDKMRLTMAWGWEGRATVMAHGSVTEVNKNYRVNLCVDHDCLYNSLSGGFTVGAWWSLHSDIFQQTLTLLIIQHLSMF